MLIGQPVTNSDEALSAAHRLMEKGCKNHVLITLGSQGALLLSRSKLSLPVFVTAPKVQAVDTTVRLCSEIPILHDVALSIFKSNNRNGYSCKRPAA